MNKKELKKYLTINSIFSGASGLVMVLFSDVLQGFFGFTNGLVFPIIGANLLVFSGFVWFVATRKLNERKLVGLITVLDALWVLGSIVIIAGGLFGLATLGYWVIAVVAVWIGFLGLMQARYNRR